MNLTVVPHPETRHLARRMVHTARHSSAADAVIEHLDELTPSQYAALITVLLGKIRGGGRPIGSSNPITTPFDYSPELQRRGHYLRKRGSQEAWVIAADNEYQRTRRRARAQLEAAG